MRQQRVYFNKHVRNISYLERQMDICSALSDGNCDWCVAVNECRATWDAIVESASNGTFRYWDQKRRLLEVLIYHPEHIVTEQLYFRLGA